MIAARSEPRFEKCLFLELEPKSVSALKARIEPYRERCSAHEGDVNKDLVRLVRAEISARAPCLVLLDPEGPDLHWSTVTGLAGLPGRNRQPELLILFPLDMALLRMLPTSGEISERDVVRVSAMFGDERWQQIYEAKLRRELQAGEAKQQYLDLYKRNLENLGYKVETKLIAARARPGTGRGRREMYHLMFATQHPNGLKIMEDVFRRAYVLDVSITEQRPLFE